MIVHWQGHDYPVTPGRCNGQVLGYLLGGVLLDKRKCWTSEYGYIRTEEGVIVVLKACTVVVAIISVVVLLLLVWAITPSTQYTYYLVSFAEEPVYRDEVLYCNVSNDADRAVTVQFRNESNISQVYELEPGESLPYIPIDFIPTVIRYNGDYDFPLEVQSD